MQLWFQIFVFLCLGQYCCWAGRLPYQVIADKYYCSSHREPICASNGKNYIYLDNQCHLDVINYLEKGKGQKEYLACPLSNCKSKYKTCPDDEVPLCAMDMKTKQLLEFKNPCEMEFVANAFKKNYHLLNFGSCPQQNLCFSNTCKEDYRPLCVTYKTTKREFSNYCQFQRSLCGNARNWLEIHPGPCLDRQNSGDTKNIGEPICASYKGENRTFESQYHWHMEMNKTGKYWSILHPGYCENQLSCPDNLIKPICARLNGTIIRSFQSLCHLQQEKLKSSQNWQIIYQGLCRSLIYNIKKILNVLKNPNIRDSDMESGSQTKTVDTEDMKTELKTDASSTIMKISSFDFDKLKILEDIIQKIQNDNFEYPIISPVRDFMPGIDPQSFIAEKKPKTEAQAEKQVVNLSELSKSSSSDLQNGEETIHTVEKDKIMLTGRNPSSTKVNFIQNHAKGELDLNNRIFASNSVLKLELLGEQLNPSSDLKNRKEIVNKMQDNSMLHQNPSINVSDIEQQSGLHDIDEQKSLTKMEFKFRRLDKKLANSDIKNIEFLNDKNTTSKYISETFEDELAIKENYGNTYQKTTEFAVLQDKFNSNGTKDINGNKTKTEFESKPIKKDVLTEGKAVKMSPTNIEFEFAELNEPLNFNDVKKIDNFDDNHTGTNFQSETLKETMAIEEEDGRTTETKSESEFEVVDEPLKSSVVHDFKNLDSNNGETKLQSEAIKAKRKTHILLDVLQNRGILMGPIRTDTAFFTTDLNDEKTIHPTSEILQYPSDQAKNNGNENIENNLNDHEAHDQIFLVKDTNFVEPSNSKTLNETSSSIMHGTISNKPVENKEAINKDILITDKKNNKEIELITKKILVTANNMPKPKIHLVTSTYKLEDSPSSRYDNDMPRLGDGLYPNVAMYKNEKRQGKLMAKTSECISKEGFIVDGNSLMSGKKLPNDTYESGYLKKSPYEYEMLNDHDSGSGDDNNFDDTESLNAYIQGKYAEKTKSWNVDERPSTILNEMETLSSDVEKSPLPVAANKKKEINMNDEFLKETQDFLDTPNKLEIQHENVNNAENGNSEKLNAVRGFLQEAGVLQFIANKVNWQSLKTNNITADTFKYASGKGTNKKSPNYSNSTKISLNPNESVNRNASFSQFVQREKLLSVRRLLEDLKVLRRSNAYPHVQDVGDEIKNDEVLQPNDNKKDLNSDIQTENNEHFTNNGTRRRALVTFDRAIREKLTGIADSMDISSLQSKSISTKTRTSLKNDQNQGQNQSKQGSLQTKEIPNTKQKSGEIIFTSDSAIREILSSITSSKSTSASRFESEDNSGKLQANKTNSQAEKVAEIKTTQIKEIPTPAENSNILSDNYLKGIKFLNEDKNSQSTNKNYTASETILNSNETLFLNSISPLDIIRNKIYKINSTHTVVFQGPVYTDPVKYSPTFYIITLPNGTLLISSSNDGGKYAGSSKPKSLKISGDTTSENNAKAPTETLPKNSIENLLLPNLIPQEWPFVKNSVGNTQLSNSVKEEIYVPALFVNENELNRDSSLEPADLMTLEQLNPSRYELFEISDEIPLDFSSLTTMDEQMSSSNSFTNLPESYVDSVNTEDAENIYDFLKNYDSVNLFN